jgi:hypothetical protein
MMSFPEVLAAARALSRAEKVQLVHALVDDFQQPDDAMYEGWRPTHAYGSPIADTDHSEEAEFLRKLLGTAGVPPQTSPVFAPEAAAALMQMLEAEKSPNE